MHHTQESSNGYKVVIQITPSPDEIIYADGIGFYSNNPQIQLTNWKAHPKPQSYYDSLRKISVLGWKQQVAFEVQIHQHNTSLDNIQLWYTLHTNQKKSAFHTIVLKSVINEKKTVMPKKIHMAPLTKKTVLEKNIKRSFVYNRSFLHQFFEWILQHLMYVCALITAAIVLLLLVNIFIYKKVEFLLWFYCCIAYIFWFLFWYSARISTLPLCMTSIVLTISGMLLHIIPTPFVTDRFLAIVLIAGAVATSFYNAQLVWYY